jgi:hypothetical protein
VEADEEVDERHGTDCELVEVESGADPTASSATRTATGMPFASSSRPVSSTSSHQAKERPGAVAPPLHLPHRAPRHRRLSYGWVHPQFHLCEPTTSAAPLIGVSVSLHDLMSRLPPLIRSCRSMPSWKANIGELPTLPDPRIHSLASSSSLDPPPPPTHTHTGHRHHLARAASTPLLSAMVAHNARVKLEATMGLAHEHNALFHFSFR